MSLAAEAVAAIVERPIDIGLVRDGVEVSVNGYGRQAAAGWVVRGAAASATVEFGPFASDVAFTEAVVFVAGRPARTIPLGGGVMLPAGSTWVHEITLVGADRAD